MATGGLHAGWLLWALLSMGPFAFSKGFRSGRHRVQVVHRVSRGEAEAAVSLWGGCHTAGRPALPALPALLWLPVSPLPWDLSRDTPASPAMVLVGLNHPPAGNSSGLLGNGTLLTHSPCSPLCARTAREGLPFPGVLGTLLLLYSGRLEKQKGRCPSPEGSGGGCPWRWLTRRGPRSVPAWPPRARSAGTCR